MATNNKDKLLENVIQRLFYLVNWIPLRTFEDVESLNLVEVGGTDEAPILQSTIAGRVYKYENISDQPYISNAIIFSVDDGEEFIADESRLLVKFPLRSKDFIPVKIRLKDDNGRDKVAKADRVKYKKLSKRIATYQSRFL